MTISPPAHGTLNWDTPLNGILETLDSNETAHAGNTSNPHMTTATQIGAIAGTIAISVSTSAPSSPSPNDMWFDASAQVWKRWTGSAWSPTPQTPVGGGTPQPVTQNSPVSDGVSTVAAREDHTHNLVITPELIYRATPDANTYSTFAPGTLGVSGAASVPALAYNSIQEVSFGCLITQTVATDVSDVALRIGGTEVRASRNSGGSFTGSGTYTNTVAAGTAQSYQAVFNRIAGTGGWSSPADTRFNWLEVMVRPAS